MSLLMPVAVVLLVSAQLPLSTQLQLPTGETAELAADYVSYEPRQRVFTARGHAVLRSGSVVLRADEVSYDLAHETAVARGNVMLVNGLMAAVADQLSVDLESSEASVQGGLFMEKRGVTPQQLLQAQTPQELRDLGETPVLMSGRRIKRTGDNTYQVEGIALAPCLCGESVPSWRVEASSARVEMGQYASLTLPIVFVRSVPVLAVPWLYLPLSERQSGLLFPRPTSSAISGFGLELPVFITLGRSYDLTLTPGFNLGGGEVEVTRTIDPVANVTLTRDEPRKNGIRGPRLLTEFRYAPAVGTEGRVTLGLLYDLQPVRNPVTEDYFLTDTWELIRTPRGLRGEASLQHRQDLGGGWYDRIDASVVSDGFYTRDLTADIIARAAQYLSSSGVIYRRGEDQWVGLEVGLRQDIRWGYDLFGRSTVPLGARASSAFTAAPRTFQRLPTLSWVLAERPLGGSRLVGGMRVEFTRLSPLLSLFGDEGLDGHFGSDGHWVTPGGSREPDLAQGNGVFDGADREARDRVDLLPRLSTSFALGSFARLSPALSVRQDFYLGEVTGRAAQRGYPILDLVLDSRLARTFELGGVSLLHSLEPSITLRYVPTVWGDLPSPGALPDGPGQPYDEIDSALPSTPAGVARRFLHAVVELNQTLHARRDASREELLRLSVGQGFDLSRFAPTLGRGLPGNAEPLARDTFGRLSGRLGRLSGTGLLRYDPNSRQITQLSADFRVEVPQANLYARYDDLLGEGSDRLRRGLDALVGPAPKSAQRAQFLTAGTQATFGFGLGLRYEALLQPQTRSEAPLLQQTFGVSYGPACNCWRVEGLARLARGQARPDFGVNFTVTGVGTFGSGG